MLFSASTKQFDSNGNFILDDLGFCLGGDIDYPEMSRDFPHFLQQIPR
jgi:hypothetical protein